MKGFTLLEVLVALAIFSISASTLIVTSSQSVKYLRYAQERVLASWVAEEAFKQISIQKKFPDIGSSNTKSTAYNRKWYIKQIISEAESEIQIETETNTNTIINLASLRSVQLIVYLGSEEDEGSKIYQLKGFIRRIKP
ncbi:MAG: type II secretion system minor pseudopilin GspI [Endozoicomonadaceae bacterium]|nr:type II secretion system minor pseudopilin GspI [Endozoicomonadaceae bacterium]